MSTESSSVQTQLKFSKRTYTYNCLVSPFHAVSLISDLKLYVTAVSQTKATVKDKTCTMA